MPRSLSRRSHSCWAFLPTRELFLCILFVMLSRPAVVPSVQFAEGRTIVARWQSTTAVSTNLLLPMYIGSTAESEASQGLINRSFTLSEDSQIATSYNQANLTDGSFNITAVNSTELLFPATDDLSSSEGQVRCQQVIVVREVADQPFVSFLGIGNSSGVGSDSICVASPSPSSSLTAFNLTSSVALPNTTSLSFSQVKALLPTAVSQYLLAGQAEQSVFNVSSISAPLALFGYPNLTSLFDIRQESMLHWVGRITKRSKGFLLAQLSRTLVYGGSSTNVSTATSGAAVNLAALDVVEKPIVGAFSPPSPFPLLSTVGFHIITLGMLNDDARELIEGFNVGIYVDGTQGTIALVYLSYDQGLPQLEVVVWSLGQYLSASNPSNAYTVRDSRSPAFVASSDLATVSIITHRTHTRNLRRSLAINGDRLSPISDAEVLGMCSRSPHMATVGGAAAAGLNSIYGGAFADHRIVEIVAADGAAPGGLQRSMPSVAVALADSDENTDGLPPSVAIGFSFRSAKELSPFTLKQIIPIAPLGSNVQTTTHVFLIIYVIVGLVSIVAAILAALLRGCCGCGLKRFWKSVRKQPRTNLDEVPPTPQLNKQVSLALDSPDLAISPSVVGFASPSKTPQRRIPLQSASIEMPVRELVEKVLRSASGVYSRHHQHSAQGEAPVDREVVTSILTTETDSEFWARRKPYLPGRLGAVATTFIIMMWALQLQSVFYIAVWPDITSKEDLTAAERAGMWIQYATLAFFPIMSNHATPLQVLLFNLWAILAFSLLACLMMWWFMRSDLASTRRRMALMFSHTLTSKEFFVRILADDEIRNAELLASHVAAATVVAPPPVFANPSHNATLLKSPSLRTVGIPLSLSPRTSEAGTSKLPTVSLSPPAKSIPKELQACRPFAVLTNFIADMDNELTRLERGHKAPRKKVSENFMKHNKDNAFIMDISTVVDVAGEGNGGQADLQNTASMCVAPSEFMLAETQRLAAKEASARQELLSAISIAQSFAKGHNPNRRLNGVGLSTKAFIRHVSTGKVYECLVKGIYRRKEDIDDDQKAGGSFGGGGNDVPGLWIFIEMLHIHKNHVSVFRADFSVFELPHKVRPRPIIRTSLPLVAQGHAPTQQSPGKCTTDPKYPHPSPKAFTEDGQPIVVADHHLYDAVAASTLFLDAAIYKHGRLVTNTSKTYRTAKLVVGTFATFLPAYFMIPSLWWGTHILLSSMGSDRTTVHDNVLTCTWVTETRFHPLMVVAAVLLCVLWATYFASIVLWAGLRRRIIVGWEDDGRALGLQGGSASIRKYARDASNVNKARGGGINGRSNPEQSKDDVAADEEMREHRAAESIAYNTWFESSSDPRRRSTSAKTFVPRPPSDHLIVESTSPLDPKATPKGLPAGRQLWARDEPHSSGGAERKLSDTELAEFSTTAAPATDGRADIANAAESILRKAGGSIVVPKSLLGSGMAINKNSDAVVKEERKKPEMVDDVKVVVSRSTSLIDIGKPEVVRTQSGARRPHSKTERIRSVAEEAVVQNSEPPRRRMLTHRDLSHLCDLLCALSVSAQNGLLRSHLSLVNSRGVVNTALGVTTAAAALANSPSVQQVSLSPQRNGSGANLGDSSPETTAEALQLVLGTSASPRGPLSNSSPALAATGMEFGGIGAHKYPIKNIMILHGTPPASALAATHLHRRLEASAPSGPRRRSDTVAASEAPDHGRSPFEMMRSDGSTPPPLGMAGLGSMPNEGNPTFENGEGVGRRMTIDAYTPTAAGGGHFGSSMSVNPTGFSFSMPANTSHQLPTFADITTPPPGADTSATFINLNSPTSMSTIVPQSIIASAGGTQIVRPLLVVLPPVASALFALMGVGATGESSRLRAYKGRFGRGFGPDGRGVVFDPYVTSTDDLADLELSTVTINLLPVTALEVAGEGRGIMAAPAPQPHPQPIAADAFAKAHAAGGGDLAPSGNLTTSAGIGKQNALVTGHMSSNALLGLPRRSVVVVSPNTNVRHQLGRNGTTAESNTVFETNHITGNDSSGATKEGNEGHEKVQWRQGGGGTVTRTTTTSFQDEVETMESSNQSPNSVSVGDLQPNATVIEKLMHTNASSNPSVGGPLSLRRSPSRTPSPATSSIGGGTGVVTVGNGNSGSFMVTDTQRTLRERSPTVLSLLGTKGPLAQSQGGSIKGLLSRSNSQSSQMSQTSNAGNPLVPLSLRPTPRSPPPQQTPQPPPAPPRPAPARPAPLDIKQVETLSDTQQPQWQLQQKPQPEQQPPRPAPEHPLPSIVLHRVFAEHIDRPRYEHFAHVMLSLPAVSLPLLLWNLFVTVAGMCVAVLLPTNGLYGFRWLSGPDRFESNLRLEHKRVGDVSALTIIIGANFLLQGIAMSLSFWRLFTKRSATHSKWTDSDRVANLDEANRVKGVDSDNPEDHGDGSSVAAYDLDGKRGRLTLITFGCLAAFSFAISLNLLLGLETARRMSDGVANEILPFGLRSFEESVGLSWVITLGVFAILLCLALVL